MTRALGPWQILALIAATALAVASGGDRHLGPQITVTPSPAAPSTTPRSADPWRDSDPGRRGSSLLREELRIPPVVGTTSTSVPVLLIPGWGDDESHLSALAERLEEAGWPAGNVERLTFQDPVGSNREHAREVAHAALQLKARTGAERVDVVAHSMGGLATRYYLQNGGDAHVRRVVFLATPHRGTVSAYFAWGEGAQEMQPGSTFLLGLMRMPVIPNGVRAVTISTPLDLHVVPAENATLPGFPDLKVCCPTHAGLLDSAETFELIERFLLGT